MGTVHSSRSLSRVLVTSVAGHPRVASAGIGTLVAALVAVAVLRPPAATATWLGVEAQRWLPVPAGSIWLPLPERLGGPAQHPQAVSLHNAAAPLPPPLVTGAQPAQSLPAPIAVTSAPPPVPAIADPVAQPAPAGGGAVPAPVVAAPPPMPEPVPVGGAPVPAPVGAAPPPPQLPVPVSVPKTKGTGDPPEEREDQEPPGSKPVAGGQRPPVELKDKKQPNLRDADPGRGRSSDRKPAH